MPQDSKPFTGFYSPNTTPIPDQLFDELMAKLSGAELKVLLYICRRTFGFKKKLDNISIKQMTDGITTADGRTLDRGTGLSKSTVVAAVHNLEKLGAIVRNRRQSAVRGDEATTYSLKVIEPVFENRTPPTNHPVFENRTGGSPEIEQARVRKSNPQETVKQETEITVNVNGSQKENHATHPVKALPRITQSSSKTELIAGDIVQQLGDRHSMNFYRLVAARVPETVIRETLASIKVDGADHPPRLFTQRMAQYAEERQQSSPKAELFRWPGGSAHQANQGVASASNRRYYE